MGWLSHFEYKGIPAGIIAAIVPELRGMGTRYGKQGRHAWRLSGDNRISQGMTVQDNHHGFKEIFTKFQKEVQTGGGTRVYKVEGSGKAAAGAAKGLEAAGG